MTNPRAETSAATSSAEADADATPARWWSTQPDGRLLCTLCPRFCRMADGQAGFCYIRQNRGTKILAKGDANLVKWYMPYAR